MKENTLATYWAEQLAASSEHWFKPRGKQTKTASPDDPMLMPSAQMIDRYVREIPEGTSQTVKTMRDQLADRYEAVMTCPVTTRLQLTVVAEAAHEAYQNGTPVKEITPVWRVLEEGSPVLKKLSFDQAFILDQRVREKL